MSTPFDTRPLHLTDADREVWAEHERKNKRAAEMYRELPIAHHRALWQDPGAWEEGGKP